MTDLVVMDASSCFSRSFWETFCAFANSDGGAIVVRDIEDDQVMSCRNRLWAELHDKMCINIPLLIERDIEVREQESGVSMMVIHIPRADYDLKPVYLTPNPFGNTYLRYRGDNLPCTDEEVRQIFSDSLCLTHSADSRILQGYSMDDIDLGTLHWYRQTFHLAHPDHIWNDCDDMTFLENIGAYRMDRKNTVEGFTLAGILMFGKYHSIVGQECCPGFFLEYREHSEDDAQDNVWTNRLCPDDTWEANLYQFFNRVCSLMSNALPQPMQVNQAGIKESEDTAAHKAFREALLNSIVHCSYTMAGQISVDRHYNKVVISNPGILLSSIEDYHTGGVSQCRNAILKNMFRLIGLGQSCGGGSDIIAKGWLSNGWLDLPSIKQMYGPARVEVVMPVHFSTKVWKSVDEAYYSGIGQMLTLWHSNEVVKTFINKLRLLDSNNAYLLEDEGVGYCNVVRPDTTGQLKKGERKRLDVLTYVRQNPGCRTSKIAEKIGLGLTQTKTYLHQLVEDGFIESKGANRNRTYSSTSL